ncbi:glutamyl-tRNA reductase [Roseibacillus ishigakijimensis]|uniref:Glutamyl-tRNA reductase n=1 Tax=Roseibacillus ishigakijimensis TaxID=454146 RepID=A0A934RT44_9BACT|nr:glutamyl-tRNA reductase [Roseibacillus ishigakijimensis]MBK1834958.1 glutamyl-tRNA reductase [Roseibacillus ishigakijimensis]
MKLFCLGLNHETAPVELREKVSISNTHLGEESSALAQHAAIAEGVVISTCNRTEFYLAAESREAAASALADHLQSHFGLAVDEHFYEKNAREAAVHLCRVVSGLDSMVLGETEIFGQVKKAYAAALDAGVTGGVLNRLFQRAFSVGKKVRNSTGIQEGQTSVGSVAVDLAEKIFGHLKESQVMVIGAGEMSRTTAQSLLSRGAQSMFVTNRSYDKAVELAKDMGGSAIRFDDWEDSLTRVDIIISSTGAPHHVIRPEHIEKVRRKRKFRPLLMVDIAVPRDIDPEVGEIDEVYLYDVDGLQVLAAEARKRRQEQIRLCEAIIEEELAKSHLPGL